MPTQTSKPTKDQKLKTTSHTTITPRGTTHHTKPTTQNITTPRTTLTQISKPTTQTTPHKANFKPSQTGVSTPTTPHTPGPTRTPTCAKTFLSTKLNQPLIIKTTKTTHTSTTHTSQTMHNKTKNLVLTLFHIKRSYDFCMYPS